MARFEQPEEVQNKEHIIEMTNITMDYHQPGCCCMFLSENYLE